MTHIAGTRPIDDEICATCFACGRGYCRGDGRFCSTRCREAFDAGFPPAPDSHYARAMTNVPLSAWRIVAGPPGIEIGARIYDLLNRNEQRKGGGRGIARPAKNVAISLEKSMVCKPPRRVGRCPQTPRRVSPSSGPHSRVRHTGQLRAARLPLRA